MKTLTIILISYLNMGSSVEKYKAFYTKETRVIKEILDINPKSFYLNALNLSVKYLGSEHTISQKFVQRYIRLQAEENFKLENKTIEYFEMALAPKTNIKKVGTPSKGSEDFSPDLLDPRISANRSMYNFRLENNDESNKQEFKIRGTSLNREVRSKQNLDVDTSRISLDVNHEHNNDDAKSFHDLSFSATSENKNMYTRNNRRYKTMNPQQPNKISDPIDLYEQPDDVPLAKINSSTSGIQDPAYRPMIAREQRKGEERGSPILLKATSFDVNNMTENNNGLQHQNEEPTLKDIQKELKNLKEIFQQFESVLPNRLDKKLSGSFESPSSAHNISIFAPEEKPEAYKESPNTRLFSTLSNLGTPLHQVEQPNITTSLASSRFTANLPSSFSGSPTIKQQVEQQAAAVASLNTPVNRRNIRRPSIHIAPCSNEPETDKSLRPERGTQRRNSLTMVLPIPTTIDTLDSPAIKTGNNTNNSDFQNKLKYAIISKTFFLSEDEECKIVCKATWTKDIKTFSLELAKKDGDVVTTIHQRELQYKNLQAILKQLQYKDVLPLNSQVKNVKSFYNLVKFLLLPFTHVYLF